MSSADLDLESIPKVEGGHVVILASKWHSDLVNHMVEECKRILTSHGITKVEILNLPGTLEMPLAASWSIHRSQIEVDAVVCLSVVEKGSTAHFDMIVHSTTRELMGLSVTTSVPVINEILAVYDIKDAVDRAMGEDNNKGIEAAAAALEMIALKRTLKPH